MPSVACDSSRATCGVAYDVASRERLREQRVAREDAGRLAEALPRGGLPAPLLVVVERRQVVVDE